MNVTVVVAEKVLEFKMYLATVTCYNEFSQLLLQAESIQKFFEPCTHVIIVNEDEPDVNFYYRWLSPYYKNHELLVVPSIVLKNKNAYDSRKIQKLLVNIASKIDDDCLLLHTNNFFIKPTKLSDFENTIGSGKLVDITQKYKLTNEYYANYFNVAPVGKSIAPKFPFVLHQKYMSMINVDWLSDVLFKDMTLPMNEFLFYTYLVDVQEINDFKHTKEISKTIKDSDINMLEFKLCQREDDVKVYSLDKKILHRLYPTGINFINDWLSNHVQLNNKVYPYIK